MVHRAEPIAPARRIAPFSLPAIGMRLRAHNGDGQPITAMPVEKDRPMPRVNVAGAVEIALTIHLDEARPARQSPEEPETARPIRAKAYADQRISRHQRRHNEAACH